MGLRRLAAQWRALRRFEALPAARRAIVFYSEGPASWPHLEPLARSLREDHGWRVAWLASSADDPVFGLGEAGPEAFAIGEGAVRTFAFATMSAGVVVTTMPDLQTYYIKRSPAVSRYAYVHHSLVSTHMIYRPAAFDHFDAVLCAGPHHEDEIRARERMTGLPAKRLFPHGYGRLDTMIEAVAAGPTAARVPGEPARVVVAPSWGENGLFERHAELALLPLLEAGFDVTARPHPRTRQFRPDALARIASRCGAHPRFRFEEDVATSHSLVETDLLVSDWSGAALEYAFARLRPVLFVDVPRKVNNPDWASLGIEPVEASLREIIGEVVPEAALDTLGARARALLGRDDAERIAQARARTVYHLGESGRVGASALVRLWEESGWEKPT